ncbi:MAG: hypothetical protein OXG88_07625 [Gammaproteobacteria bacterium]|nr:hypothetical protein [Gammaproteobacteria bacterium]
MKKVQEVTLNLSSEFTPVRRRLYGRKRKFRDEFKRLITPHEAIGLRVSGVPIDQATYIDDLFEGCQLNQDIAFPQVLISRKSINEKEFNKLNWILSSPFKPILRGARIESVSNDEVCEFAYAEVQCDGLMEIGSLNVDSMYKSFLFDLDWITGQFATLLVWADRFRKKSSIQCAKYAIEVEISVKGEGVFLGKGQNYGNINTKRSVNCLFPTYLIESDQLTIEELKNYIEIFQHDLFNSVGWHVPECYAISSACEHSSEFLR